MKAKSLCVNLSVSFVAVCLTILVCEVVFRALLFSSPSLMKSFRRPGLYADAQSSDDYWKLRVLFGEAPATRNDPMLG